MIWGLPLPEISNSLDLILHFLSPRYASQTLKFSSNVQQPSVCLKEKIWPLLWLICFFSSQQTFICWHYKYIQVCDKWKEKQTKKENHFQNTIPNLFFWPWQRVSQLSSMLDHSFKWKTICWLRRPQNAIWILVHTCGSRCHLGRGHSQQKHLMIIKG